MTYYILAAVAIVLLGVALYLKKQKGYPFKGSLFL